MATIPIVEIVLRALGSGIPGAGSLVQHLTLAIGFLGAMLASRDGKMLALATASFLPEGKARTSAAIATAAFTAFVCGLLAHACTTLALSEREFGGTFGPGIPTWAAMAVMPLSFATIAWRELRRASAPWFVRLAGVAVFAVGVFAAGKIELFEGRSFLPWLAVLVAMALFGAPIFAVLGAAAAVLFLLDGVSAAAVPLETYSLTTSPFLAAIPLFTVTGFVLAEGQSSQRLLGLFRALFGWMPGGTAIVTVTVCAFFTAFTGGSGVTILALGGLLLPSLLKEGYGERFSLGTLTASGSLGLLFPPALPLILYGVVAEVDVKDLFVAGILPGILLVSLLAMYGVRQGVVRQVPKTPFSMQAAGRALWTAKFELAIPLIALGALFSGRATLIESAAVTAAFAIFVQVAIHREIGFGRPLFAVLAKCATLLGGVLIILGVAKGLSNYMVDAMIPDRLLEWASGSIESKWVFLLLLNLFLLLVGAFMDIFSAIVVVVPLVRPLGEQFGIDPVHLGIIFIANLELGYLTPPVGLNLFLASYRFERPLLTIYRAAVPMLLILGVGVLLITYVPALSLAFVGGG